MPSEDQIFRHVERGTRNMRATLGDLVRLCTELSALALDVSRGASALAHARRGIDRAAVESAEQWQRRAVRAYWSCVLELSLAQADVTCLAYGSVPLTPDAVGLGLVGADLALLGGVHRAARDLLAAHMHPRAVSMPALFPEGLYL